MLQAGKMNFQCQNSQMKNRKHQRQVRSYSRHSSKAPNLEPAISFFDLPLNKLNGNQNFKIGIMIWLFLQVKKKENL